MRDSATATKLESDVAADSISVDRPLPCQSDALAALCLIARLHHIAAEPAHLAHQLGWTASRRPSPTDLLLAARHIGLKAKSSRTTIDRLTLAPLPALAVVRDDSGVASTVVLAQCDGQRVLTQDPSGGAPGARPVIEPLNVFAARWTGELILIASRASLAGDLAKFDFSWFIPSLVKYRRLFGEVLIISLFLQLFALISPLFFQVVMDKVLVHKGMNTLDVLVVGLLVVVVFESVLTTLRTYVFSHTTSRIDVELGARLFRHLVSLPLAYFQARRVGDSVARVRELENIRSFLTGNAVTLVLDLMFSIVFIAVMLAYSVPLTLIVLVSLPLYALLSATLMPVLRARLNEKFARGAENQALLVETVTGIQTVKANALEPALAKRWDDQLAAYVVDTGDVVIEAANAGTDTVDSVISWSLGAQVENLMLSGSAAINGTGNALANVIRGNSANNALNGGAGNDTLIGGAGDDTYFVDAINDVVHEEANDGIDSVSSAVSWILGDNVESLVLSGLAAINGTGNTLDNSLTGNAGANRLDGGTGADSMSGGAGNDVYIVDDAADTILESSGGGTDLVEASVSWTLGADIEKLTLTGSAAINATGNSLANTLVGNAGRNRLDGGTGADAMSGGAGDDIYVVDNASDTTVEPSGGGNDTVESSVTRTLGAELENLTLTGTTAISGTGNALANLLRGNAGDNALNGGAGADTMMGGRGNDSYVVDVTTDAVVEFSNEGLDTVTSSVSFALSDNIENLTLIGGALALTATGNALNNVLTGNGAGNVLSALAGDDTLVGAAGTDTLLGGVGNDLYVVANTTDVVVEKTDEGTDTVQSSVTYTLSAEVENLLLTGTAALNGTGNVLANLLIGNGGANKLSGGAGADTMIGATGNDTYVVDDGADVIIEDLDEGVDLVQSSVGYALASNIENLTLTGTMAIGGTGNALNNVLIGNAASNALTGGAGSDTLNGGGGSDTMAGGLGNDVFVVNGATDVVVEAAGEGVDTVQSAITWTLGANVENLTLTGGGSNRATGNELANILIGNTGANTLTGNAGGDTLDGGAGADTLIGGIGDDIYMVGRGYGTDLIQENDSTLGNTDVMQFMTGITMDQIWFRKSGNDLEVNISGTTDKATVQNWYLGSQYHVEQFKTSDGKTLLDSQVQTLVTAMAGFSAPAIGLGVSPPDYQRTLLPTIAANLGP